MELEQEKVMSLLEERLEIHDNSRKATLDKLQGICQRLRGQIDKLEDKITKELSEEFSPEDDRLQGALNDLRENKTISALQKAKAELLVFQSYEIAKSEGRDDDLNTDLTTLYELKTGKCFVPELIETRKPTDVRVIDINRGRISINFTCLNPDCERVLSEYNFGDLVKYKCVLFKKENEQKGKGFLLDKKGNNSFTFTPDILGAETSYGIRVKMMLGGRESEWSDIAEFIPEFKECCTWKKCPDVVGWKFKYNIDKKNPRIATKINNDSYCTIIGDTFIPLNTVTSWNAKILRSRNNDGYCIYIGMVPNKINQTILNFKRGWYFSCYSSRLYSGPPHNYSGKEYGPRKEKIGQYVHTGNSVCVVMNTTKGDLSFVLNGVNLGVAYKGIPLDKPLVPCVILWCGGDSVELF